MWVCFGESITVHILTEAQPNSWHILEARIWMCNVLIILHCSSWCLIFYFCGCHLNITEVIFRKVRLHPTHLLSMLSYRCSVYQGISSPRRKRRQENRLRRVREYTEWPRRRCRLGYKETVFRWDRPGWKQRHQLRRVSYRHASAYLYKLVVIVVDVVVVVVVVVRCFWRCCYCCRWCSLASRCHCCIITIIALVISWSSLLSLPLLVLLLS